MSWLLRQQLGSAGYETLPADAAAARHSDHAAAAPASRPPHAAVDIPHEREQAVSTGLLAHAFHDAQRVLAEVGGSMEGLTAADVAARRKRWGLNVVAAPHVTPAYRVLWNALAHPFNAILLALAGTAAMTQDPATALIMLLMVFLSTALRFWQETKSTVAAARLIEMLHMRAAVVRRHATGLPEELTLDLRDLVPGDLVVLRGGQLVPADVRLLACRHLFLGEAALTGESMPAEKRSAAEDPGRRPALLDCRCLALRGCHVVSGTALGVAVATGPRCYVSTLAEALQRQKPQNAFQLGVRRVSWLLIAFMACLVPVVILLSGLMTHNWAQAAIFGISVAVGLTPEMLPMVVNANLARGAVAMARRRCIVKRLDAVQNLGAMDILCTDKTGTLTRDEVVLTRWLDWRGRDCAGALRWGFLNACFVAGGRNLLDDAIVAVGEGAGLGGVAAAHSKLDEAPFSFIRRRASVLLQESGAGAPLLVCKGAVEEMAPLCAAVEAGSGERLPLDDSGRQELLAVGERLNSEGLRVLAVAVRELPSAADALQAASESCDEDSSRASSSHLAPTTPPAPRARTPWPSVSTGAAPAAAAAASELGSRGSGPLGGQHPLCTPEAEHSLVFCGFLAFLDPPKPDAAQAVRELQQKSIQLKVLTGDSLAVACQVCAQVSLPVRHAITGGWGWERRWGGPELARLGASEFCDAARKATVLAKLTPGQKARVVAALKGAGHTVGFLGDGANDAPALRNADVGISVDSGSDIAKDAADVILLQKSLRVLEAGVVRGRITHGNTIKYIKMTASSNFGNVFSILLASAWLPFQPMRPLQLLTQNLLYDLSQTAIPFDRMDASYVAVPRPWSAGSLFWFMLCIGPTSSIFDVTTFCLLWFVYGARSPERQALFQTGWFTLGLLTQTLIVHLIRTERLPFVQEVAAWPVVAATLLISAIGLVLPYTPVGALEGMVALPPSFYAWVAATIAAYAATVQLAKRLYIRRFGGWL